MDTLKTLGTIMLMCATLCAQNSSETVPYLSGQEIADEKAMIDTLATAIMAYRRINNGREPSTITDLRNILDLPSLLKKNQRLGDFGDRYALITKQIPYKQGNIFLLGLQTVQWSSNEGRTIERGRYAAQEIPAYKTWGASFIPEKDLPDLLAKLGHAPPPMGPIPSPTIAITQTEDNSEYWKQAKEFALSNTPPEHRNIPLPDIDGSLRNPDERKVAEAKKPATLQGWLIAIAGVPTVAGIIWFLRRKRSSA